MSKHLKQQNAYGCGLYALANSFQDEKMITPERLEASKNGNHVGQLNKWLLEQGKDLFLDPFYFDNAGDKLPKWICEMTPQGEDVISIPVFLSIQYSAESKTHFVAAEITTTGNMLVIDSLKDEPYFTTLEAFNDANHRVIGIWYLRHYTEDGYIMRHKPQ